MATSINQPRAAGLERQSRFVRVTARNANWIEFEFSIGDPALCVEMILTPAQFAAFCQEQRAKHLSDEHASRLEQERRKWHDSMAGEAG
ncbi:phenol hydroxylase subunit [Crenobacter sp. SG2305]|uniref:phenol hydroxylase subunit n=1 Tax=Crenobacter oryzisoli TaxID=3056844 RepID=UPI0025AB399F|nr:phenol hydroxylase subunit [Crenobacter sp. SG2305]MDN0083172.1 phenol hydroxylase subunit [Crenobacter sp. SG2305]